MGEAIVGWVLLGLAAAAGILMLRRMGDLWAAYADEVYRLGPRMQYDLARRGLRATGLWLLTVSANIGWTSHREGVLAALSGMVTTGVVGVGFLFGFGNALGPRLLLSDDDYDEPIGPEPDPEPHLRSLEALEHWLGEEE